MAVIYYQLFIVLTLLIVRATAPKLLPIAALFWSALTLINLFYPPLIVIQLAVVWITFAVLRPRSVSHDSAGAVSEVAARASPSPDAPRQAAASPVPLRASRLADFNPQPSWVEQGKVGQFNAAVMLEAIDCYSLPLPYVAQFVGNAESASRLLGIAALRERSGQTFEEQAAAAARRLKWEWDKLPSDEREGFHLDQARLDAIKF